MSENESIQTRRPDGTHRVVITGVGAVTPAGVGAEALWETLMERGCCIAPIERFDTSEYEVHIAGEVRDFDGTEHGLTKKEARRFERFVQYAIVAADEALAQSGLEVTDENRDRIAVVFGTGIGGIDELQKGFATLEEKGPKRVNPLFIPTMIGNIAAGNLAIRYGMRGECLNVVTACATGAHCIGTALRDIRHGYIDAALVGGTEESVSPICIAGFTNLSALTRAEDPKEASLPFDARRGGFVAGEGAGALVIESLESALARGAEPIAEIIGFGSTGDAYHMTAPDPEATAITAAMAAALAEGGFTPADLGHLNAHGTGTPANDATESKALANLMGGVEAAASVPVTSIKGTTGHMLGAAGAVEAIVCALSVAPRRGAPHGRLRRGRRGLPRGGGHRGYDRLPAEGGPVDLAGLRRPQRRFGLLAVQRLGGVDERRDDCRPAALGARGHRRDSAPSRSVRVGEPYCGHRARCFHRRRA